MASDFLDNYIVLAVGRVGLSTDFISERAEFVQEVDKRRHLMDLLHAQRDTGNVIIHYQFFVLIVYICVLIFLYLFCCSKLSRLSLWKPRGVLIHWKVGCAWMGFQLLVFMEIETSRFVFVFTLFRTTHFAQQQTHLAIIIFYSI